MNQPAPSPRFALVLLVFDPFDRFFSSGLIQDHLARICALNGRLSITLVNNNVPGNTPNLCKFLNDFSQANHWRLVQTDGARGLAEGYNLGISASDPACDYFVLVSCDTQFVDPDTLPKMHQAIATKQSVGLAHPMSVFEDSEYMNISEEFGLRRYREYWRTRQLDAPILDLSTDDIARMRALANTRSGLIAPVDRFGFTCVMIKRQVWQTVGKFDEGFQYCFENIDYVVRALKQDYQTAMVKNVFVNHRRPLVRVLWGAGTGEGAGDPNRSAYESSQRYWYYKWKRTPDAICEQAMYGKFGNAFRKFYGWGRSRLSPVKRFILNAK